MWCTKSKRKMDSKRSSIPILRPVLTCCSLPAGWVTDYSIFIRISAGSSDSEYDDLGAWSRLKRGLTRRWTSQIGVVDDISPATVTLEEGGAEGNVIEEKLDSAPKVGQVQSQTDRPGGMLGLPVHQSTFMKQEAVSSRPSSAGKASSKGSSNWNNSVMVEEEVPTWLQQYGARLVT